MMEKKKKSGLFYFLFLLVYILVVMGVIAFFMTKVWGFAEEYEAARPAHTMDAYVEDLNQNLWNDQVAQAIADMPHEVQSDEECAQVVKDMLSALKVGDRICTIGGLYGTITALKEDTVTLKIGSLENTVVVTRWAIRSVENVKTENDNQMPEV